MKHDEVIDDEPARKFGSRGRSSSVGSDGLIIEGRQHTTTHLRNVLHGLGRGYIQPDRDHSQLKAAAASAAATANANMKEIVSPSRHSIIDP